MVGGHYTAQGETRIPKTIRNLKNLLYTGKLIQPIEGWLKMIRESDTLIVLGDGRAVHRGKGCTELCSPQRKHVPDM